jgi:hypothetical protein
MAPGEKCDVTSGPALKELEDRIFAICVDEAPCTGLAGRLDFEIQAAAGSRYACLACRAESQAVHDRRGRSWRRLNFFQYQRFIHAEVPRSLRPVVQEQPSPGGLGASQQQLHAAPGGAAGDLGAHDGDPQSGTVPGRLAGARAGLILSGDL